MKPPLPLFAALMLAGLAGPLCAETPQSAAQFCLAAVATDAITPDCAALRQTFDVKVSACMAERLQIAQSARTASAASMSHGYKGRYLLCAKDARNSLMASGN